MNILSFDIEEWYLEKEYGGGRIDLYRQYDAILDHILSELSRNNRKATFFCLGRIATDFPDVVKKIGAEGHEIGSHSHAHKWVNKMTPEEFREDTHAAVAALEDLTGKKVRSFRAPAFSIGESNKWALEILAEAGIENDASVFPGVRDFGGFPQFALQKPCKIAYNGITINEFPIPLQRIPVVGKELAYSGGGYFRLLPLSFVRNCMGKRDYNICYFHIADLLTEKTHKLTREEYETYFKEKGTWIRRELRYFKSNVGRSGALAKFDKILASFPFTSIEEYLKEHALAETVKI